MIVVALGLVLVVLAAVWVPWDPVPGGPLVPPDPAELFTPAEIARAEHLSAWARLWSWSGLVVGLVVACVLGFTRLGPRLVARLRGPRWLVVVQAVAAVLVIGRLLTLPFSFARHRLLVEAGLSTQGPPAWLGDVAKAELVHVLVVAAVVLLLVACAGRWARAWPVVAGGLLAALTFAASYAYPLVVEPAFNSFTSLQAGSLRDDVFDVAEQEGVVVDDVLVADASRRTTTLNAYVSGVWGSRRVVLYDNLVEEVPPDEVLAVVAHELAHARHDDVLTGTALGAVGAAWAVGLLALLLRRRRLDDPTVVPWLLAMVAIGTLVSTPVQSTISRQVEMRADVDAVKATGDPAAFEEMQVVLAKRSLADPTPPAWSQLVFGSHPTVLERVALARRLGSGG
jgi:STE24 endopeptidase